MNIADVLELAIGRPPSVPVNNPIYHEWMQMLEREWYRWERFGSTHPDLACWFKTHPECIAPYGAWVTAGKPAREWTLQQHLDAISDHTRAAMGVLRGG